MNHQYARRKLTLLLRDLDSCTAGEFWREMSRIACGATGKPHAEELEAERDALTAHVERLNNKLGEIKESLYGQNLRVSGWHLNGDTTPMDSWFEDNDWEQEPTDSDASLARIKAQWQAEAVSALRFPASLRKMWSGGEVQKWLDSQAAELRRQAEGEQP